MKAFLRSRSLLITVIAIILGIIIALTTTATIKPTYHQTVYDTEAACNAAYPDAVCRFGVCDTGRCDVATPKGWYPVKQ